MMKKESDKKKRIMLQGAAVETVQRFGSAVKEHLVSFSGKDRENGLEAKMSLKSVSERKVDPANRNANIKQQAGFSAEIKAVARENAEHIISGKKERTIRTDDIPKQFDPKGREIGRRNDPLYDLTKTDENGNIIWNSSRQMKFVGNSPEKCAQKLLSGKFDKYRESDVPIEIPKDFYDKVLEDFTRRENSLETQIRSAESRGDTVLADKHRNQLVKIKRTKASLQKGSVTSKEAIEARMHPALSVAKDVVKVANRAGLHQAVIGATFTGALSIIQNVVACMKDEKTPDQAAKDFLRTTGESAAFSYSTAFAGAIVKGAMQNSNSVVLRSLSGSALPSVLVSSTIELSTIMINYINGSITGTECIESLCKEGVGQIGSTMCSTIMTSAVQGAGSSVLNVAMGLAGSSLGFMAAVAVYKEVERSLEEYRDSKEQRIIIEKASEEAVALICQYREEMMNAAEMYLNQHLDVFASGFKCMDDAILKNDVEGFISGNNRIQALLEKEIQFRTQSEFDDLMGSDDDFKL